MDSIKKSLLMISLILICSANGDDTDTEMPDYKDLLKNLDMENTSARIQDYMTKCINAANNLCLESSKHYCTLLSTYMETIIEFIVYDEVSNVYAKSLIHFVYEQTKAGRNVESPKTFCSEFKPTDRLSKEDCERTGKTACNTMQVMFFEWSNPKIHRLDDDLEKEKMALKLYLVQHKDNNAVTYGTEPAVREAADLTKLYCGTKMCKYEIDKAFKSIKLLNHLTMNSNKLYISHAFTNIVISEVEFPTAIYFIVYLYKAVDISSIKSTPDEFCKKQKSTEDCEEQIKTANFGSNIDEVVENIYFNWSIEKIDKLFPKNSYVKQYVLDLVKNYTLGTGPVEFKYNSKDFCNSVPKIN